MYLQCVAHENDIDNYLVDLSNTLINKYNHVLPSGGEGTQERNLRQDSFWLNGKIM